MKIHQQPMVVVTVICFVLFAIPVAGAGIVSNGTTNHETFSPTSQYSIFINPVTEVQTGQPLEITGISDAPEGSPILITGESRYSRMHPHLKMWNFSHDMFVFEGKIRNLTEGKRNFSAIINTSTLRPDDYFVTLSINEESDNKTQICLEPNRSQLRKDIILDSLKSSYSTGDDISVSGLEPAPEIKSVYGEMILERGIRESSQDNRLDYQFEGLPLKENRISGLRSFQGTIDTKDMVPGNYTLQVAAFDEEEGRWFAMNQSKVILTDLPIPGTQQKSGDPFAGSFTLALTSTYIAVWQYRRRR